jgi:hypothetical protein
MGKGTGKARRIKGDRKGKVSLYTFCGKEWTGIGGEKRDGGRW